MKKRIFSMLLALCMVVSMLPLGSIRAKATVTDTPESSGTDAQQPGDVGEIIVGEGTDTSRKVPLDSLYNYNAVQYVIPETELEDVVGKGFFALTYYYNNPNLVSDTRSLAIYLQEVESPTLQGFADVDQGSQVFSGSAKFTGSELHIELDDPYLYSGKDLLVTVIDSTGAYQGTVYFYGTAALGDAVYAYRDSAPYDVGALDNGYQSKFTPKMKISTADLVTYRVTAGECENGTVSASRETACAGQTVVLEAIPAEGYCLRAFTVLCGEETVEVSEDGTFVMPDGDVTVTAEFRKLGRYSITVKETANGTVTAVETAYETDTVTLQVTPAEGYMLESLTAENNDALVFSKVNDTTYTFVMPAENVTIVPTFVEKSTIVLELADIYSDGWTRNAIRVFLDGSETPLTEDLTIEGGSRNKTYTLNVPKNATLHFQWIKGIYANECSFTITRDGLLVYEALPGSLEDTENETLLCTSRPVVYYDVTVTETTNGTVEAPTSFVAGQQLTLGITPDTDYILDSLTVTCSDGTPVEVDQNYTFTMPESDITITAAFRALGLYNITVAETANGTVTAAEIGRETDIVNLTVIPNAGYMLDSLTVTCSDGTPVEVDQNYTFAMPKSDITITAAFRVQGIYNITVAETANGTVTAAEVGRETETVNLTVSPAVGYKLESLVVMQGEIPVEVSEDYTFIMPAGDVTVTAVFEIDEHVVGHYQEGKKLIWFNGAKSQAEIDEILTRDADGDGYQWVWDDTEGEGHDNQDALFCSISYDVDNGKPLNPDNWLILPVFELDANGSYWFAFSAKSNDETWTDMIGVFVTTDVDEISENSLVQVGSNERVPGTMTDYEYDLSEYAGNDIRVILRHYNSHNRMRLSVDCLRLYQGGYSVSVNSGENGTVTADKAAAKSGETVTLTVTPDAGYTLESLTVMQGETPVEVSEDYTFVMPAGDVTVSAQWAEIMVAVIPETGAEYGDLDVALNASFAAETALTVKLLQDMTWSGMVMKANLDLNGHVLTVDHHLVVFDNAQILDSSESNSGLLVLTETAQKYLKLPINNVQLPVYGSRIGVEDSRKGYAFVEVEKFNSAVRGDGSDFAFQPVFEPVAVAALAENLAESRVKVIVRVSWANDKGEARSQDFLYSDALVQSFLDSYDAAGDRFGEMFTLKLKSDLLQDFSFQVLVKSAIGSTIASDSLRNSAE